MRKAALASVVMFTTACDGGFAVRGRAVAEPPSVVGRCTLSVAEPADALSGGGGPVDPQNIQTRFTVAPSDVTYTLALLCAGYEPYKFKVRYGKDVSPSKPLEFGTVILVPAS